MTAVAAAGPAGFESPMLAPVIPLHGSGRRRRPGAHDWTLTGVDYTDDGRSISEYACRACGEIDFR